jgi:glutathione S-transferase
MAINFYLAKKHNSPLYPSDPRNEALALQWSFWEVDRLDRTLANYLTHTSVLPEAERDKSIADAAWAEVEPAMNVLNGALRKSQWLAGPAFSVADLNVACALWRCLGMDLSRWPAMRDWFARCWDRPAGKRARAAREG